MNDSVKSFIASFHQAVKDNSLVLINQNYDANWGKLTEKFFKQAEWPSAAVVAPLVGNDTLFVILYKEMYYRHLFSRLHATTTLEHRIGAWDNYAAFFDHLLNKATPVDLELPNQWIWDIIDEFIYQFQDCCTYSAKLKLKSEEEFEKLKKHPHVWSIHGVLRYLQALVDKSQIAATLAKEKATGSSLPDDKTSFALHPLYKSLGYFSLVGQLRVQTLLGDYNLALQSISSITLNKKGLYTKVIACYITLYYYTGFVYMMMRRFVDAIRTFAHILQYISRIKQFHTKSYQYDIIMKRNEQMYALLAILISFCTQRLDEQVNTLMREKYAEKMAAIQRGEIGVVEELFTFGCPKFISPVSISESSDVAVNTHQEMLRLQVKIFMNDIKQQSLLPIIRSYLKLYTTISVDKLATLLERKVDVDTLHKILLCYAHKTRGLSWSSGEAAASGKMAVYSDIDFTVDNGMVTITDAKPARRFGEYFTRNANKFDEIITDLHKEQ